MTAIEGFASMHATDGQEAAQTQPGIVRGSVGWILRAEGALVLAGAAWAFQATGGNWALFALLFLAPDIAMLGFLAGARVGTASYNAAHSYLAPAVAAAILYALGGVGLAAYALIWAGHIGFDRMLGFGLKYPDAFGATHLGWMGKRR